MSDLCNRVRAHLDQCHRHDQSEQLLAELLADHDRLKAECAATAEREDLARWERNELDQLAGERGA